MLNPLASLSPLLSEASSLSRAYAATRRLETFILLMILKTNLVLPYILNTCAPSQTHPYSKTQACSYSGKGTARVTLILPVPEHFCYTLLFSSDSRLKSTSPANASSASILQQAVEALP